MVRDLYVHAQLTSNPGIAADPAYTTRRQAAGYPSVGSGVRFDVPFKLTEKSSVAVAVGVM